MMRVLLVARYLQREHHRKVEALAAQPGLEVWHVAPDRWRDELRPYTQEVRRPAGYTLCLARPILTYDIHRYLYWPPDVYLARVRPDLIHLEDEPDSLIALQVALARRLWAPQASLVLFTWQNIERRRRWYVSSLGRWVLLQVDYLIAGSAAAREAACSLGYCGPAAVLPQIGLDPEVFSPGDGTPVRESLGLAGFVAGYVGRLVPQKGVDLLLHAVALLPEVSAVILGSGPMEGALKELARELGTAERVRFVPAVPVAEVPAHLRALDVLVLPSRTTPVWKEQFGHVLIEAMACGVPTVGSYSGAIPEVIGPAGLLFPEGDAAALADALEGLRTRPALREHLARIGRQRVLEHYTHEQIAHRTADIYRQALAGRRGSA